MKNRFMGLCLCCLLVSACVTEPRFTNEAFPRIDGSTATKSISDAIATRLLSMDPDEASEFIRHNKTHEAYVNLIEKIADIILVSEPSKDELALAASRGITLELTPVAIDRGKFY